MHKEKQNQIPTLRSYDYIKLRKIIYIHRSIFKNIGLMTNVYSLSTIVQIFSKCLIVLEKYFKCFMRLVYFII